MVQIVRFCEKLRVVTVIANATNNTHMSIFLAEKVCKKLDTAYSALVSKFTKKESKVLGFGFGDLPAKIHIMF